MEKRPINIHWFRKGLRLHDNPALTEAANSSSNVLRPIFILDEEIPKSYKIGRNRWRFLLESLKDLDNSLRGIGTRLFICRGQVETVFDKLFTEWGKVELITYEYDTEPYARERDKRIAELAKRRNIKFQGHWSHTLYEPAVLLRQNGLVAPKTYQKFLDCVKKAGEPRGALDPISKLSIALKDVEGILLESKYNVPTLEQLGIVEEEELGTVLYPGGETEALKRLESKLKDKEFIENFQKPETSPNSLEPSTTVLSPYLKFGCLSPTLFYEKLKTFKQKTKPPVSLLGQLYWREFYYLVGCQTANFTKMKGNSLCKQIAWDDNRELVEAWKWGRTGYPFVDALMTQLRREGWIHHLGRHSVACFLTRGDLWQSWEKGQEVFEEWLLDADVYLNAGNWMWLSASAFFHQYYRVYSPVAFGKKTDPTGAYIKKYLPILGKFPKQYIYEPWTAPLSVQNAAGCVIGKDYPHRIVVHVEVLKINLKKMAAAYGKAKDGDKRREDGGGGERKIKKSKTK